MVMSVFNLALGIHKRIYFVRPYVYTWVNLDSLPFASTEFARAILQRTATKGRAIVQFGNAGGCVRSTFSRNKHSSMLPFVFKLKLQIIIARWQNSCRPGSRSVRIDVCRPKRLRPPTVTTLSRVSMPWR